MAVMAEDILLAYDFGILFTYEQHSVKKYIITILQCFNCRKNGSIFQYVSFYSTHAEYV